MDYSINFTPVWQWITDNKLMIGLFLSAIIGNMPELLPSFKESPQWVWTWFRDSTKTFLNFRMKAEASPLPTMQEQRIAAAKNGNQAAHDESLIIGPQQLNG